jgi:cell division protein FtsW (lipid II flippase)
MHLNAKRLLTLCVPLPALTVGAAIMMKSGVSSALWLQNLGVGAAMLLLSTGIPEARTQKRREWLSWTLVNVAFAGLLVTLLDDGLQGVHRWLHFGKIRINVGAICLPALLILSGRPTSEQQPGTAMFLISIAVLAILAAQPDAAAATAFGAAALVGIGRNLKSKGRRWTFLCAVVGLIICAWQRPDPLGRVPHVEDIVSLAANQGMLWFVSALLGLCLLPLPFICLSKSENRNTPQALAIYFGIVLLAPLFANFPVPLLGYGASHIIGYMLAVAWLARQAGAP